MVNGVGELREEVVLEEGSARGGVDALMSQIARASSVVGKIALARIRSGRFLRLQLQWQLRH